MPPIDIRTYQATDLKYVHHLLGSTHIALVPFGIRRKMTSALFLVIWSLVMAASWTCIGTLAWSFWLRLSAYAVLAVVWSLACFALLFVGTARYQVGGLLEAARQYDLLDPDISYLNYIKEHIVVDDDSPEENDKDRRKTSKKRVRFDAHTKPAMEWIKTFKPAEEQSISHFWVLVIHGIPRGMVGLAQDARQHVHRRGSRWMHSLFAPPSLCLDMAPDTAVLQRLTIDVPFQRQGLGSLMISKTLAFARQHHIRRVIAVTDEIHAAAAHLLAKHGFIMTSCQRTGWFGQQRQTWEYWLRETSPPDTIDTT